MSFYERYAAIAEEKGLLPCSKEAADLFGITKSTISAWNSKNMTPKGETVARIADEFGVSADFLLGRTDDPTDFARGGSPKTTSFRRPADTSPVFATLYARLDRADQLKIEGVMQGMLMQDKYTSGPVVRAAHERTDIEVTDEMRRHDDEIMRDENF